MIDDIEDELIKGTSTRLQGLNKVIYDTIIDYFIDNLSIGDDTIKYTSGNIGIVEKLSTQVPKIESSLQKIAKYILNGINRIINATGSMYLKTDGKAKGYMPSITETLMKHAATNLNANFKPDPIFAAIKEQSLRLMSRPEGIGLKDLRETLYKNVIDGNVSEKYFARWTGDIYSQYQRVAANQVRKKIGLKHARYAGGLIETSRPFCIERNGNTYTEEEIESWADEDFQGKPDTYDPIIDLGGYNCRHRLDWISEELFDELNTEGDGDDIS